MALQRNECSWLLLAGLFMTILAALPPGSSASQTDEELVICLNRFDACFNYFVHKYRSGSLAYTTTEEENYRKGVLKANVEKFLAMEHDPSYRLGLNSLMDRTSEEFTKLLGALPPSNNDTDGPPIITRRRLLAVPDSVDWRTKGVLPPIKNQYSCGSCWAFGTTAAVEAIHAIKCKNLISLSEQEVLDCSGAGGCPGGVPQDAMAWMVTNGLTSDKNYPYTGVDTLDCDINKENQPRVFIDSREVENGIGEDTLKSWLVDQPVTIGFFRVKPDFQALSNTDTGIYLRKDCGDPIKGWHTMLAVGYGSLPDGDYWIVRNSWGTGWGDKGYVKIARGGAAEGFPTAGLCNLRDVVIRPIKKDCSKDVDEDVGCNSAMKTTCDFRFLGIAANQKPPKFTLGSGKRDRAISTPVVDSKTGMKVETINTNGGFLFGDLPTGQPAVAGKPPHQFYGAGQKVWVQTFNPHDSLTNHRKKCVVLPLTHMQLKGGINLHPGDGNKNYPEDRRCVIFETL